MPHYRHCTVKAWQVLGYSRHTCYISSEVAVQLVVQKKLRLNKKDRVKTKFLQKKLGEYSGSKNLLVRKLFWSENNFDPEKCWIQKLLGPKKFWVLKNVWSKKSLDSKNFWVRKIFAPKNLLCQKNC